MTCSNKTSEIQDCQNLVLDYSLQIQKMRDSLLTAFLERVLGENLNCVNAKQFSLGCYINNPDIIHVSRNNKEIAILKFETNTGKGTMNMEINLYEHE